MTTRSAPPSTATQPSTATRSKKKRENTRRSSESNFFPLPKPLSAGFPSITITTHRGHTIATTTTTTITITIITTNAAITPPPVSQWAPCSPVSRLWGCHPA
eukprot:CAMPEP_0206490870 /NCGR_PEP_ID=MMETSP0324_2-20121206/44465_1 /ASSEMBLY_ACC=CAM_ASM_000836 /TAXON_ID=2866 /ORGANISM="Crypthecodinium cohnii, Strain Seligo" /LENGTH=101 /DNA_ID=CAMNT_0053971567 /DNA_START=40 /DNA_END=341 /DNA_ORIENTATION=-